MRNYTKINNVMGWLAFLIAAIVYILTLEPTVSFWDCGEYIATAYKLQVGHPPGAPMFQMLARFFTLFAFGDTSLVAYMVNLMSALASALTIMFLFWTISALGRKVVEKQGEMDKSKMIAIFGSAFVGAMAYTFSDSFWFSAVEGEVYATSSFFTAVTFWAILKWERVADQSHNIRWIIFIAFLIGISIGVHLLNLLAIPAVVFVYYFRKYKPTRKGVILSLIISVVLLYVILYIIIPLIVKLSGKIELLFVNSFGLPFNSGTIFFFLVLIGTIAWGIHYTHRKRKVLANTILLSLTFLLIGYSAFFMLVIRSHANPPIDENNPEDAVSFLSYLNREQYGETPLIYGQYYNAPLDPEDPYKDGSPSYMKDTVKGKYVVKNDNKNSKPNYDDRFCTLFPRMWSSAQDRGHPQAYKQIANVKGTPIKVRQPDGSMKTLYKPTFGENLKFFFKYQVGFMYFRYFMWNFAGRQNRTQGFGNPIHGNWISGIKFIDEWRLGPQDNIPPRIKEKGTNKFYFLPLLLGIIGLIFHLSNHKKDFLVVTLLFLFTGLAIVVYLNQYPHQPRERDYAYAASFYAFAIWIGLGVYAIFNKLRQKINPSASAIVSTLLCLALVPGIMAEQGWDDHDRSNRYTALDFAKNYLNSCEPNAVLFTHGDNDTFPLWYAQEVEGIRTDVRVIVLTLFNTDWNVNQMRRKAYKSEPLPFTLSADKIKDGTRDIVYFMENNKLKGYYDLKKLIEFVGSDNPETKIRTSRGNFDYFPTKKFKLPVDSAKVVNNGTVPKRFADSVVDAIKWKLDRYGVYKNHLMMLDFIATSNWERPIYFAVNGGEDAYLGLEDYFVLEGLAYRLVPAKMPNYDSETGSIDTKKMYDNVMNEFEWGNMEKPGVYLDATNIRQIKYVQKFRKMFGRLAIALEQEGKKDSAIAVCDKCIEVVPPEKIPYNYFMLPIIEVYYKTGERDKGKAVLSKTLETAEEELKYFNSFTGSKAKGIEKELQRSVLMMREIGSLAREYNEKEIADKAQKMFELYYQRMMPVQ